MWRREGWLVAGADEALAHLAEERGSKEQGKGEGDERRRSREEGEGLMPALDQHLAVIWRTREEGVR